MKCHYCSGEAFYFKLSGSDGIVPICKAHGHPKPMMCHYCPFPATHERTVVDLDVQGLNLNERGYKRVPICIAHAIDARGDGEARVSSLSGDKGVE